MMQNAKNYEKLFNKINKNAKVCIYGTNDTAENIFEALKELRPDVEVKFFINTKEDGSLKGLPIYRAVDLDSHLDEFDTAIAASYSSRFFMEFVLKAYGVANILLFDKEIFKAACPAKKTWDVNKSARVFQTHKDRQLYRFLAKARKNKKKYEPLIKKHYDKHYPNRIINGIYPFEHYFEFLNKDAVEVALDGGACNGIHSLIILQMLPNCKKVYMFEPCYDSFRNELFDKLIKRKPEIEIVQKALWKEDTKIQFREDSFSAGSAVVEVKPHVNREHKIIDIDAITIDTFVEQNKLQKLDFIKMDLENAEMPALKGAEKSIQKFRPQMAISIYHSDEQFYEIPLYLKNTFKDYIFRLGQYRGWAVETVLYAIPKELAK